MARRRSGDEIERLRREVARGAGLDVIERLAKAVREREAAARPRPPAVMNRHGCTFLCLRAAGVVPADEGPFVCYAYATLPALRRFLKQSGVRPGILNAAMAQAEVAAAGVALGALDGDVRVIALDPDGDAGWLYDYEDEEEWQAALRRDELASTPRRPRSGRPARPVEFSVENGQLHIRLDPDAREEVEELLEKPVDQAFADLIEWHLGNGWTLLDPDDVGALTASPILSNDVQWDEDGNIVSVGRVFWFPEYQVKSEIEELLEHGEVVFRGQP